MNFRTPVWGGAPNNSFQEKLDFSDPSPLPCKKLDQEKNKIFQTPQTPLPHPSPLPHPDTKIRISGEKMIFRPHSHLVTPTTGSGGNHPTRFNQFWAE